MGVNRIEVIDHTKTAKEYARAFVKWVDTEDTFEVEIMEQDDGRTLKIFLSDKEDLEVTEEWAAGVNLVSKEAIRV